MEIFNTLVWSLFYTVSGVGVVIVLTGVVEATWRFLRLRTDLSVGHTRLITETDLVRERMGAHLLLGLDFFIAADIIKTTLAPSWENVGILAAVVGIRIVLSYFLSKEMEQTRRERNELRNQREP